MYRAIVFALALWVCVPAQAHEMTPTYVTFKHSHITGVVKTSLKIFNKRSEVDYYEIGVFDESFNPVIFVTPYRVIKIPYLSSTTFDVYIRRSDLASATYICSESKLKKSQTVRTVITSRICSKIQNG